MASYIFRPPIRHEGPRYPATASDFEKQVMRHFQNMAGPPPAVLITGSTVTEVASPTVDQMKAADLCLMGGYENVVTQATADLLTANGYGANLTLIP